MIRSRLYFEDGTQVTAFLAARPLIGEFIEYDDDRYRVKDIYHVTSVADTAGEASPELVLKLGIGRKGSHRHVLEKSPRGFYTGSD
jgi:hypothetical protein